MYVDSHCHLSFPELAERLPEIRLAMAEAGVDRALCICTTLEEFDRVHALATTYGNFWCSAGVHPDSEDVREPGVDDLLALAAKPRSLPLAKRASTTTASASAASPTSNGNVIASGCIYGRLDKAGCRW